MFCSKCGAKNIEDAKFCQECGNPLNSPDIKKNNLVLSVTGRNSKLELYDYYVRIKALFSKDTDYMLSDIISTEIRPPHGIRRYPKFKFHIRGLGGQNTGSLLAVGGSGVNYGVFGGTSKQLTSVLFDKKQEPEFLKFKELIDLKLSEIHNK